MRNFYIDFFKPNSNGIKLYSYKVLPSSSSTTLKVKLFNAPNQQVGNFNLFYIPHAYSINSSFYSDFSYKYFLSKWKKYELKKIYKFSLQAPQVFPGFSKSYSTFRSINISGFKNLTFKRKNRIWLTFFTKFATTKNSFSRYFKLPLRRQSSLNYLSNRKKILRKFKNKKIFTFLRNFYIKNYRKFYKSISLIKRPSGKFYSLKPQYFIRRNFIFKFSSFLNYCKTPYFKDSHPKFISYVQFENYFEKYSKDLVYKFFYRHPDFNFFSFEHSSKKYLQFFRRRRSRYFKFYYKYKKFRRYFKLQSRFFRFNKINSMKSIFYFVFKRYFKKQKYFRKSINKRLANKIKYRVPSRFFSSKKPFSKFLLKIIFIAFSALKRKHYTRFKNYFSLLFSIFIKIRYLIRNVFSVSSQNFDMVKFNFFKRFYNVFTIFRLFSESFPNFISASNFFPDFSPYFDNSSALVGKFKFFIYYRRRYFVKLLRFITFYKFILINLLFSKHHKLFFKLKKKLMMFCYFSTRNGKSLYLFPFLFYKTFYFGPISFLRTDIFSYDSGQITYNITSRSLRSRTLLVPNF